MQEPEGRNAWTIRHLAPCWLRLKVAPRIAGCRGCGLPQVLHTARPWSLRRLPLAVINMQNSACNDTLQVSYSCRLSLLWGPAGEALGKALEHQPGAAWPLVHATLAATQAGFLSGADRGTAALNM